MRYNLLNGAGGHWFPGRSAADFDGHSIQSAIAGHPYSDKIPDILREAHELLLDAPKKRLSQGG
jgi:predicted aldo/keto reductase-like oxidoreductase